MKASFAGKNIVSQPKRISRPVQFVLKLLLGGSMEDLLLVKEYVDAAAGR